MADILDTLPPHFRKDVHLALKILQQAGCTEIFLFGSIIGGRINEESDIDIAIKGCPKGLFFRLYGQLIRNLAHPVDLIDLDKQKSFYRYLQEHGELVRVA
ncbi:MAG: nucleotidyltransferase domain-containing protein [Spirochaetales bacterium]|nr:nucleotidyltransferase domain-containing protein [Spirochaetales bacterium]